MTKKVVALLILFLLAVVALFACIMSDSDSRLRKLHASSVGGSLPGVCAWLTSAHSSPAHDGPSAESFS